MYSTVKMNGLDVDLEDTPDNHGIIRKALESGSLACSSMLQIRDITNLSVAKRIMDNHGSSDKSDVFRLELGDGEKTLLALILHPDKNINMRTAPGAKILIVKDIPIKGKFVELKSDNFSFLGGRSPKISKLWELKQKHASNEWGASREIDPTDAPPHWRKFNEGPFKPVKNIKAMEVVGKPKDQVSTEKTEFEKQRDKAIKEVKSDSKEKEFAKPTKQVLDKDLETIMAAGFTKDVAEEALRRFKNPKKAINILQKQGKKGDFESDAMEKKPFQKSKKFRKGRHANDEDDDDCYEEPTGDNNKKPSKQISLFGFVETQLSSDKFNKKDSVSTLSNNLEDLSLDTPAYDTSRNRDEGRTERGGRRFGNRRYKESSEPSHFFTVPPETSDFRRGNFGSNRGRGRGNNRASASARYQPRSQEVDNAYCANGIEESGRNVYSGIDSRRNMMKNRYDNDRSTDTQSFSKSLPFTGRRQDRDRPTRFEMQNGSNSSSTGFIPNAQQPVFSNDRFGMDGSRSGNVGHRPGSSYEYMGRSGSSMAEHTATQRTSTSGNFPRPGYLSDRREYRNDSNEFKKSMTPPYLAQLPSSDGRPESAAVSGSTFSGSNRGGLGNSYRGSDLTYSSGPRNMNGSSSFPGRLPTRNYDRHFGGGPSNNSSRHAQSFENSGQPYAHNNPQGYYSHNTDVPYYGGSRIFYSSKRGQ